MSNYKYIILISIIFGGGIVWGIFLKNNISTHSKGSQIVINPIINDSLQVSTIAEKLDTPWSLVFLPDKSILVTERPGRVRLIDNKGSLQPEPVAIINETDEIGEGGLLGMTLHPNFASNKYVYLYYTYREKSGNTFNRVVRMTYQNSQLNDQKIIADQIPGSVNHNGGRIKFGPDGYLYISTGDAGYPSQAQNINSLGGKILRVTDEGNYPPDNPFNNFVYSYGHRNVQGLAWDEKNRLWATEHGPSGNESGWDELNIVEKGKNYGWPEIKGDETRAGLEIPVLNSGSDATWAPAGAVFYNNSLFFAGLRGQSLFKTEIKSSNITLTEYFKGQFGRLRDVIQGPDGFLYITTSNRDGRGDPQPSDDRILRIYPKKEPS